MIGGPAINMRIFHRRFILRAGVVALILIALWVIAIGPEPPSRITISPDELVRAVTIQRDSLIDLCLMERVDPNGRDGQGRTPLLIATSQQDWKTARRLLDAGAVVDLADKNGFTPVMAAAMHGDLEMFGLLLARSTNLQPEKPTADGQDLLSFALDGGHPEIIKTVEQRLPTVPEWTTSTRRALSRALQAGKNDEIRLLLSKQSAPPTPEGKNVPFLAYAIASSNVSLFSTLLNCGADPNTVLPSRCDKDFLALLPKGLRSYIEDDRNVTVLMLASGLGQVDYLRRFDRRRSKPDAPNDPEQNVGIGCCRGDRPLAFRANSSRRRACAGKVAGRNFSGDAKRRSLQGRQTDISLAMLHRSVGLLH